MSSQRVSRFAELIPNPPCSLPSFLDKLLFFGIPFVKRGLPLLEGLPGGQGGLAQPPRLFALRVRRVPGLPHRPRDRGRPGSLDSLTAPGG